MGKDSKSTRCLNCFKLYEKKYGLCPYCGTELGFSNPTNHLAPGTKLLNRYDVGKSIGDGGFGIIYKAWDNKLQSEVALKEFYPYKIVKRSPKNDLIVAEDHVDEFLYRKSRFIAEDRITAEFRAHKNIVTEYNSFEDNNTVYMVMEYLVGDSLATLLESGNSFSEEEAINVVKEVGLALSAIHNNGIIHRDVSPDNIFIVRDPEYRVVLLDFGAAKLLDYANPYTDILLKKGYSSPEQYRDSDSATITSDVYSLAATLYKLLTNETPIDAQTRERKDTLKSPRVINPDVSHNVSAAVMNALRLNSNNRPLTIQKFISSLDPDAVFDETSAMDSEANVASDNDNSTKNNNKSRVKKEKTKKKSIAGFILLGILLAIIAGACFYYFTTKIKVTSFVVKEDSNGKQSIAYTIDSNYPYPLHILTIQIKGDNNIVDEYNVVVIDKGNRVINLDSLDSGIYTIRVLQEGKEIYTYRLCVV